MCVDRPAVRAGEDAAVVRVEVQSLVRVDQGFLAAITLERKRNDGAFIFVSPLWFLEEELFFNWGRQAARERASLCVLGY